MFLAHPVLFQNQSFLQGALGPSSGRLVIETKIWALGVCSAIGMPLLLVPQWTELEDTRVYHTHI